MFYFYFFFILNIHAKATSLKFKDDLYSWGWRQFIKLDV